MSFFSIPKALSGQKFSVALSTLLSIIACNAHALTPDETTHLLGRTGFGASPSDRELYQHLSREQAVERLLESLDAPLWTQPPAFTRQPHPNYWAEGWQDRETTFLRINEINQLQAWWLQEMVVTPSPFADRMTLFWHNLFVSRFDKTHITAPFLEQLMLFRDTGNRNFRSLTRQVLQDPMMLSGLDNIHNTKHRPNENLGREFLELFTLGIGTYSQEDVRQVARVLAGHGVAFEQQWRYRFDEKTADRAEKRVLGQTINGNSDKELDELVDILLQQPQTAKRLAQRFYNEFVSLTPAPQEVERLAQVLRDSDYDIRTLLQELLLSPAFWDERNRGVLLKSPLELVIGFARTFELVLPDQQILVDYSAALGQAPFMAPSVEGWRGGLEWLSSKTLTDRERVIQRLWQAVQTLEQRPQADALQVRFASEYTTTPVRFKVSVNNQIIKTFEAKLGANTQHELSSNEPGNLKPMWEWVSIPRKELPENIHTVTVTMDVQSTGSNLFVNWIALDGYRFSPQKARWSTTAGSGCQADSPLGSFYCNLSLVFEVSHPIQAEQATLEDRHAPLNSNLEYGTGRQQLQCRITPCLPIAAARIPNLKTSAGNISFNSVLASAPLRIELPLLESGLQAVKALTLDPAYNLK
ncbi:DUF1800 domain-containing protein [Pseudomonas lijiangensis]|uniref:DUF1800 domain-containing protein n=1 Tax=Pseudomonas lijiangensis TaxID=2995658 RepID=UPI0031BB6135